MRLESSPKDLWAGLIYVAVGTAALWIGSEYRIGTAGRMGPGYFPRVLASILVLIGVVSIVKSYVARGSSVGAIGWKPLLIVLSACILFGLALPRVGLIVSLFGLCMVSATASPEFRLQGKAVAGLLGVIALCALVFVKGLGVPMPLLGSWLEPVLGGALPWLR